LSIYLPDHLSAALDKPESGEFAASNRIAAIIDRYHAIVSSPTHCPAISSAGWCLILDACNGWASWAEAGTTLMCGIAANVEDHAKFNAAGEKWELSEAQVAALVARLNDLTPAETMSIIERIERFWRRSGMYTDSAMAASGIVPVG
jgi:hypothetical protein